ncbi:MAG: Helicase conserved C-terminal domain [Pseudomonadota bacterium]
MADTLYGWLASLPDVAIARLAGHILGESEAISGTRARIAARLRDTAWLAGTMAGLDPAARRALSLIVGAALPVRLRDVAELVRVPESDPLARLEELGLVAAENDGLVAPSPGLAPLMRPHVSAPLPHATQAAIDPHALQAGHRRRLLERAGLLAALASHPPRSTRDGRLHASDAARLVGKLTAFGWSPDTLERRVSAFVELGAVGLGPDGRWWPAAPATGAIETLFVAEALAELSAPATPDAVLALVTRLRRHGPTTIEQAREAFERQLLQQRATAVEPDRRSARSEVKGQLARLLTLSAVVVSETEDGATVGLDPAVAAMLDGVPAAAVSPARGHVTPSLEVVADGAADASLLAAIGLFTELDSIDRAVTMRLTPASVARGRSLGMKVDEMRAALSGLTGRELPPTVGRLIESAGASPIAVLPLHPAPDVAALREAGLWALGERASDED